MRIVRLLVIVETSFFLNDGSCESCWVNQTRAGTRDWNNPANAGRTSMKTTTHSTSHDEGQRKPAGGHQGVENKYIHDHRRQNGHRQRYVAIDQQKYRTGTAQCRAPGNRPGPVGQQRRAGDGGRGRGVHGSLEDTDGLRSAAAEADGVIHTGYVHDFSPAGDPAAAAALDGRVIAAFGEALAGTGRPLVVASGLPHPPAGGIATEEVLLQNPAHPRESEPAALAVAASAGQHGADQHGAGQHGGVRASVVRLPPSVHGEGDYWFIPIFIGIARKTGSPPSSARAPTVAGRAPGWTPPGCSALPWSRRQPGHC